MKRLSRREREVPPTWARRRDVLSRAAEAGHSGTIQLLEDFAKDADEAREAEELSFVQWAQLLFSASSMLINLGALRRRRDALKLGRDLTRRVLEVDPAPGLTGQLKYNQGNALAAESELDLEDWMASGRESYSTFAQIDRERLREMRTLWAAAAEPGEPALVRGAALCNLGNALDHSGRWLEAYQAYADALVADPTNGNAAGNAAELLRRRIATQRGQPGHYAAVYEQYRLQAR